MCISLHYKIIKTHHISPRQRAQPWGELDSKLSLVSVGMFHGLVAYLFPCVEVEQSCKLSPVTIQRTVLQVRRTRTGYLQKCFPMPALVSYELYQQMPNEMENASFQCSLHEMRIINLYS